MTIINVVVARNDEYIGWANSRPTWSLPNGNLGVVYRGLVMPVYSKRFESEFSIEISDTGFEKENCSFWNKNIPFKTSDQSAQHDNLNWYIETNQFGHYLVFDGDELIADRVTDSLENNNIKIRSSGISNRCADNGYKYDWYLRLQFDGSRDEILELISRALEAVLASSDNEVPATALETELQQLRTSYEDSLNRLELRTNEYDELKHRYQDLNQEHQILQNKNNQNNQINLRKIEQLNSNILRLEMSSNQANEKSTENQQLHLEKESLQARLTETEELYYNEADLRSSEQIQAQTEINELQEVNRNLRIELTHAPTHRNKNEKYLTLLESTLSNLRKVEFHPDASDTIAYYFQDNPSQIIQILFRLNAGENIPSRAIRGADGWFELNNHISTGQNSLGRIYFRRANRLYIVIHKKKDDQEQTRFFRKLSDPNFLINQGF